MRKLINVIITSSIMIVVIMLLRKFFESRVKSGVICVLWALVAMRLLIPVQLFGNVINVADYLTDNIKRVQGSAVANEEQPDTGDNVKIAGNVQTSGNTQGITDVMSDGRMQAENEIYTDKKMQEAGSAKSDNIHIISYMRGIWFTGMALMFLIVVVSNIIFYRRLISTRIKTGNSGRISIYITDVVDSACLYGVFRPAVYLNTNTGNNEFIINHELTHYRHRDNWWTLVRMLCVCIYWFNPLVWLAAHFHKEDCELFCDEAVVRKCSAIERQKYGEVLLNAAARRSGRLSDIYLLSGASSGYRELKKRIERIAVNKKTYKSAAFVIIVTVAAITVFAFGGSNVKGSAEKSTDSRIEADTDNQNDDKMQNYLIAEYRYDLTHDGVDNVVAMEIYGYAGDISNVNEALNDTRKYVTVTVKDGVTGQTVYTKEVGNSHSLNGFVSIVSENGSYYIMDGIKGIWQGDGLERYTVYDLSSGLINVYDECKVDYYATEEAAERVRNRGEKPVSQQEADAIYNDRIARWNDGAVVLIECIVN